MSRRIGADGERPRAPDPNGGWCHHYSGARGWPSRETPATSARAGTLPVGDEESNAQTALLIRDSQPFCEVAEFGNENKGGGTFAAPVEFEGRYVQTGKTVSPAHARARSRAPTAQRRRAQYAGRDGARAWSSFDRARRTFGSGAHTRSASSPALNSRHDPHFDHATALGVSIGVELCPSIGVGPLGRTGLSLAIDRAAGLSKDESPWLNTALTVSSSRLTPLMSH